MGRPPLPLATWGVITTARRGEGWQALTRYRDSDGTSRRVTATGKTRAGAIRALRESLAQRFSTGGQLVTSDTRIAALATFWLQILEAEGRVEQSTVDEY